MFGSGTLSAAAESSFERLGAKRALRPDYAAAGSARRKLGSALGPLFAGHFFRCHNAYAGRGDRAGARGHEGLRGRLRRLARRRIDDRARQGARACAPASTSSCIPTTYAGSEMTPILGETEDGLKTTRAHRRRAAGNRHLRRRSHAARCRRPLPRHPASTPSRMRSKRFMPATPIPSSR